MNNYWMQYLGLIVLLGTLFSGGYLIFRSDITLKRIGLFASIGIFVGAALLLASRITSIKIPLVGEIKATAQQVRSDANEVKGLREQVERQRDEIALVVRDANKAHEDLERLNEITREAGKKLVTLENAVSKAEEGLQRLDSITEFSMLMARATNDDRYAFDSLVELAESEGPFKRLANRAVIEIAHEVNPLVQIRVDPKVPWEDYNMAPEQASLDAWHSVYKLVHPLYRPAYLSQFWQQGRFSKYDRLSFLNDVIKSDGSLRTVHRACMLMNKEAQLNKNILAKHLYLEWWDKNKEKYETRE